MDVYVYVSMCACVQVFVGICMHNAENTPRHRMPDS